jgi:hypothetical protein
MSGVALVQFSSLNLEKLLPIGRKILDRSLSEISDDSGYDPPLHHMLCVASIKSQDIKSNPESCAPYLNMFHAGFLIAADERDFTEILELASVPAIVTETIQRGYSVGFLAGSLSQWKDALLRGCQKEVSREVRHIYNKVYWEFKNIGLSSIFNFNQIEHRDSTFLLEYKP